jgi:Zn-dependent M28 family amino/carboxypeptidase
MIASPNFVRFVYDGDGSDTGTAGPPGSAEIEQVFLDFFESRGAATDPTAFDGRSDYGPFIDRGAPAGGLFSGAEGIKTPEQAAVYGGTAGVAYDHCYHQPCDTLDNLNRRSFNQLSNGAATALATFANLRGSVTSAPRVTPRVAHARTASLEWRGGFLQR